MPIVHHQSITPSGEVGIWEIQENEMFFLQQLDLHPAEHEQLAKIKGQRRVEWLAARQLVHQMSGRSKRGVFIKDKYGKPHLEHTNWSISISHSRRYGAAIASPHSVGIDIQKLVPKITRIIPKFMNKREQETLEEDSKIWQAHIYWGAKEALYKAYGRKELDFCQHILIEPVSFRETEGHFLGSIQKGELKYDYQLYYQTLFDDYMLVYCIEKDSD